MAKTVLVLLADGFEEIEAITIVDILRRAELDVILCGINGREPSGAYGVTIKADKTIEEVTQGADAVVIPGGMPGADNLSKSARVNKIIKDMYASNKLIAAICASPAIVLAPTGVLRGKKATAYPGMEKRFSKETTFKEERVVIDGNIITSRGPGTAISFSLAIVEKLLSKGISDNIRTKILA